MENKETVTLDNTLFSMETVALLVMILFRLLSIVLRRNITPTKSLTKAVQWEGSKVIATVSEAYFPQGLELCEVDVWETFFLILIHSRGAT